jgi:site-specific DNA recombinase
MNQLRCAIYARFSSDRQSPTSITDQVRKCREHAQQNGWLVLDEHLYVDEAISGASTDRAGLQRLLAAVAGPSIPFDCILIDDSSRLTRRLADALNLFERLTFAGIRIVAVSQGVDSDNPQAELLMSAHGMIDAVYWRELAQKTHHGMQGCALGGLATGGRCFGYRSVKDADQSVRLRVEENEAVIVRRLFEMYASGLSLKRIAWQLNTEAVQSPQPRKGRISRSWCVSSIRHILRNPRYRGQVVWNTKRKIRAPGTGRRIYRRRPESEWVITDAPHLRIISDELFARVTRRFAVTQKLWGQGNTGLSRGQQKQVYLFSGLLHCAECGGSITLVGGRAKTSRSEYGCSLHAQRGNSVCANDLLIRRDHLEERLISGLNDQVLHAEVVDYVVAALQEELHRRHESLNAELKVAREERQRLEGELRCLVETIAAGSGSPAIMAGIHEREKKLRAITNKLIEPGPGSLQEGLDELRVFAITKLSKLRTLLSSPGAIHEARALLAEQVGKLTLERVGRGERATYRAKGQIDFFGEDAFTRVGGAGGQNRTGYARLFRAALYQ